MSSITPVTFSQNATLRSIGRYPGSHPFRVFAIALWLTPLLGWADSLSDVVLQGRVVEGNQKSVPAARVRLQASGTAELLQAVQANEAGEYQIQGVAPGVYELVVFASYFAQSSVRGIRVSYQKRLTIPDIELRRDMLPVGDCSFEDHTLSFDLLPEADQLGGLTGVVRDSQGKPVVGAVVTVFVSSHEKTGTTKTDRGGHFFLSGLPPRRNYTLAVQRTGIFPEQVDGAAVRKGFVSHVLPIVVEPCQPGQCQPYLKQVRVLPGCS